MKQNIAAPGTKTHPEFELLHTQTINSLNIVLEEYRHKQTGAMHYHMVADNPENVFLVALRTVPMDSTGVAHILEHTALCGSKHYPVRDPFFMMTRRSLNTFMNAFTSSDWTAYPFSSQNKKDFYNLMDVYLDAVFFSRLNKLDFAQEGHRLEFEVPDDDNSNLVFKGVVFNEMKGAMSSPVSTLWQTLSEHLFPTTTYHYNSGGDPERIPDLTYDQLQSFYRSHYHPSNAVFMTYGDIPVYEHHCRFHENALSHFTRIEDDISVPDEQRYDAPVIVEEPYAIEEGEEEKDKAHIVMGWLLTKSTNLEDLLKARLLSSVLLDNSASPLRHALETTKLGASPSPLCGIEDSSREMSFVCGIEGSRPENARALEKLVLEVLQDVANKGVSQDRLEAVLHQLELNQREIGGDGYPYGLQLILDGLSAAIHGGDPVAVLNLDPVLETLRREIQDPDFIKRLVREWLLDNPHRVRLCLKADAALNQRREIAQAQRLAKIKASLSQPQRKEIVQQTAQLLERQQQHDDPDVLPKVGLQDVPAQLPVVEGQNERIAGFPATCYAQGTNGLVYQQIIADLPHFEGHLLDILPYYTNCLTEVGCGKRDYLQTQTWQDSVSGGINAYSSTRAEIDNVQSVSGHFILSGKALTRNHDEFSELMHQTFMSPRFDEYNRIREIVSQQRAQRERSITGSGHGLAMLAASSGMSPTAALSHRLRGLEGIRLLKALDDKLESRSVLKEFAAKLASIHEAIRNAPIQFLLIAEQEAHEQYSRQLTQLWQDVQIGNKDFQAFSLPEVHTQLRQMWTTSTQVNFCAKAYPTVPVEHEDAAALIVLGGFLRNGYLHRAIREQGGAYGGGAGQESGIAAFRFYSYRDPRLLETLEDFDRSIDWLLDKQHSDAQLEEAILGVIGSMDKPGSPAGEAKEAFHNQLYGRTPEQRRRFRERILQVGLQDLQRVGETYLKPETASIAVITNSAMAESCGDLGLELHKL